MLTFLLRFLSPVQGLPPGAGRDCERPRGPGSPFGEVPHVHRPGARRGRASKGGRGNVCRGAGIDPPVGSNGLRPVGAGRKWGQVLYKSSSGLFWKVSLFFILDVGRGLVQRGALHPGVGRVVGNSGHLLRGTLGSDRLHVCGETGGTQEGSRGRFERRVGASEWAG